MEVKLGANNRNSTEQTQRIAKVETVHSHTDHEYFIKNDIALIQLESPVEYTDYIQPVCLPEKSEDLPLYSTCYTVGWGKTKWDGKLTQMHLLRQLKNVIKKATTPRITNHNYIVMVSRHLLHSTITSHFRQNHLIGFRR